MAEENLSSEPLSPKCLSPEPVLSSSKKTEINKTKINFWKISAFVLALILVASFFTQGFSSFFYLSSQEAADKTLDFVNTNLLQGQTVAELESISQTGDLYSLKLNIAGREVNSYVTKDGQFFFPQAYDLEEAPEAAPSSAPSPPPSVPKSDQPQVELFVMSHCPYGLQAEKGILPAVEELGDKIDFQLKFVSYAMHGEKEIEEQLNQVCLQDEQPDKFLPYLKCFLNKGEREPCLAQAKVDTTELSSCVQKLDAQYQVTEKAKDQSTWLSGRFPLFDIYKKENEQYGVQGSPTLIINSQEVSSERSPAGYLTAICAAFSQPPEECQARLSAAAYSPGFGYQAGSSTQASCG